MTTKDGGHVHILCRAEAVEFDERDKPTRVVGTHMDITRERELDQMKSEFISTAAHELRTPLTTVLGFAELLLNKEEYGVTDPRRQQELLETIVHKAERLETIISELLDLSRIQAGHAISLNMAKVDICRLLEQVVAEYRGVTSAYRFQESYPAERMEIVADENKIEQVMENLLSNAIKFSPKGSTIKIVGGVEKERYNVQVKDEGRGMTAEQVERVFDKFYRADASDTAKEGLGLGMSIAREIVEAHGGEIHVKSAPGCGTSITFTLPLTTRETAR